MNEKTILALQIIALYFGFVTFSGTGTDTAEQCKNALKEDVLLLLQMRESESE